MNKKGTDGLRTWIEIDTKALRHNLEVFRAIVPRTTMLGAIVKSNAYGHDLFQFAKAVEKFGVDWIIVDSIVEALALRKDGIQTLLLVLGYTLPTRIKEAIGHNISLTISSLKNLKAATRIARKNRRPIKVHIKIDTGLSRQGFLIKDQKTVVETLKRNERWVKVEGLYTHFSAAQDPASSRSVNGQLEIFRTWIDLFREHEFDPIVHAAATAATLLFSETHFNMVRVGIGMYGLWPSIETKKHLRNKIVLTPVLTWKTIVSEVKLLPKGTSVGYDGAETLFRDSKLAICPIGYWHGYNRRFSSVGHVLVKGQRAKVIGRVSMDMIVVDVSSIPSIKEGSEVVLLGKQGRAEVTPYEMAALSGTSHYEITTCLNPLIKRLYI